jgi:hypothetical protein
VRNTHVCQYIVRLRLDIQKRILNQHGRNATIAEHPTNRPQLGTLSCDFLRLLAQHSNFSHRLRMCGVPGEHVSVHLFRLYQITITILDGSFKRKFLQPGLKILDIFTVNTSIFIQHTHRVVKLAHVLSVFLARVFEN